MRRFAPYLVGIVAGYMMGMMSSSRNYIPPTYMLVGLAAVHVRLAGAHLPAAATHMSEAARGASAYLVMTRCSYQSLPTMSSPAGVRAAAQVVVETVDETDRTLPSAMATLMALCGVCARRLSHGPGFLL